MNVAHVIGAGILVWSVVFVVSLLALYRSSTRR